MHLFCALEQRAIPWATDYFCCPILEQKRWTAKRETCFMHVVFPWHERYLWEAAPSVQAKVLGFTIWQGNSPSSASQAVFLQLYVPFCTGRPVRDAGEVVVCCCVPWHLWPKHVAYEPQGLGCLSINHHTSPQRGPPTWSIHRVLFPNHLTEVMAALFFPSYFILLFSHPQWISVWVLSWTGQLAGETLLLELRTGWLQKLLPVMKIQMLRMITE